LLRRLAPLFFDPDRRPLTADRMPRSATSLLCLWLLTGCYAPEASKLDADRDVYRILDRTSGETVGQRRRFAVGRAVDTLRQRLLASDTPIRLTLVEALDVAAENSRDYQRQKETLYLAALNLTRNQNDFAWRFGGGGGASLDGEMDDQANARLGDDLSASANSVYGTRVVASFVQTFLRSVISGGSFDGSSILDLTLTQPLLRGSGRRIAREPLTQAEREVVYAMRDYERFRTQFAIDVVSDYWSITRQIADLANVEANYVRLGELRAQIQELFNAGRRTITDLGRAQQDEFSADAQRVTAKNRLQTALDQFKLTLGLPITAQIELEPGELDRLIERGAAPVELAEPTAVQLCLQRRLDYRTTVDEVEDAGRRALIAEDALNMQLDFTAALNVPAEAGKGPELDWSRVGWSAGFDLDLALNRVPARNAYRSSLIAFDQAVRAREQREDQLTASVRASLRDIRAALDGYRIQSDAVPLAEERVQATTALYDAGRVQALEKLDAQRSLLSAQLSRNAAIVDYAIARLQLMNNLEAIALEPSGLRFDLDLPLPQPKTAE
jgi:outer membrane protein TolC